MSVKKLLEDARELIRDESRWCQKHLALNEQGLAVRAGEKAARLCAVGALAVASEKYFLADYHEACNLMSDAAWRLGHVGIVSLNDWGGHNKVVEAFDLAINVTEDR